MARRSGVAPRPRCQRSAGRGRQAVRDRGQSTRAALTPMRVTRVPRRRARPPPAVRSGGFRPWWGATACQTSGPPGRVLSGTCRSHSRAFVISLGQTSGCVGWVAHRLLAPCSVLGVAVKPVLLTYLLTESNIAICRALPRAPRSEVYAVLTLCMGASYGTGTGGGAHTHAVQDTLQSHFKSWLKLRTLPRWRSLEASTQPAGLR